MSHKPLTATNLAEHQHRQCDLFIYKTYHQPSLTPLSGKQPRTGTAELTKAQFQRGMDWEGVLFTWLRQSGLLLRVPAIPLEPSHLLENIQLDDRQHFFISGLSFKPPQEQLNSIYEEMGENPVDFGLAKPDLLEITKTASGIQWRVIDAKASKYVKTSHHIQIYFYTLCLQHLLTGSFYQCAGTAGVWLPPKDNAPPLLPNMNDIKPISISLLAPALDVLLFRQLPKLLAYTEDRAAWLYNPTCQGCQFQKGCKSRAEEEETLGMIPNLSVEQAQVLKDCLRITQMSSSSSSVQITDIEDLHLLMNTSNRLKILAKKSPSLLRKASRILSIPRSATFEDGLFSPVVEAARIKQIQVVLRRNFTCPRHEDIAFVVSMISDPATPSFGPVHFCISVFSKDIQLPKMVHCNGTELITKLSALLRMIENFQSLNACKYTVQFYVWSAQEHATFEAHIIHSALSSNTAPQDIRLCIAALTQGAALLQTSFQPVLLSGPLLKFLSKASQKKEDYQACLKRLGLPIDGTIPVLRKRIDDEIDRFQKESNELAQNEDRTFGQVPRVVSLKREVERQLALPIPGAWDLLECHSVLQPESPAACPSDETIFAAYRKSQNDEYRTMLQERNCVMYGVLEELRSRAIWPSNQSLLVNTASCLSTNFMDLCMQPHLRKLFYMQQFEVLTRLSELWRARIDGSPDAPVLEYIRTMKGNRRCEHIFRLVSGSIDTPVADKSQAFYGHLLSPDSSDDDNLPVEAMFDDLALAGLPFPLTAHTRRGWDAQPEQVRDGLSIASVYNVSPDSETGYTIVSLATYGSLSLQSGVHYRLSPRLVDFNTSKILSVLFETDLRWDSAGGTQVGDAIPEHHNIPFLQLILDPASLGPAPGGSTLLKLESEIQRLFRTLRELDDPVAGRLVLKASQHRATQRILSNRLSVIWGPPGTGKTYTVSLSLLRLIDCLRRNKDTTPKIIFIAAVTHAAIEACRSKLVALMDAYRSIEDLPIQWLDDVSVEVVTQASTHRLPDKKSSRPIVNIYAGTIYQLYNFSKRCSMEVDAVVIDEAGQISLASTALVLRSLSANGRIIIAGDSEQLAPILSAEYPKLLPAPLFGSVLDCLMSTHSASKQGGVPIDMDSSMPQIPSSQETIVQLTENFRLNPDLGEFVSTIYSREFKAQKFQARQLAISLTSLDSLDSFDAADFEDVCDVGKEFLSALGHVMLRQPQLLLSPPEITSKSSAKEPEGEAVTHRPVSLSLIRLATWSSSNHRVEYEAHVRTEATLAAALVFWLRQCSPRDDVFVATPHRIQREAVKTALRSLQLDFNRSDSPVDAGSTSTSSMITVDTIERLQGTLRSDSSVQGGTGLISSRYNLLPGDLRRAPEELFGPLYEESDGQPRQLNPELPTLLLFECVLAYIEPAISSRLLNWFANVGQNSSGGVLGCIVYEMFGLQDSFGRVMINNLKERSITIPGAMPFTTLGSVAERLLQSGFKSAQALTLKDIRRTCISFEELER
ncbi:hypothetical protein CVT24_005982 [Panaeolus cyanescens]|uniref:Uncharacterized protein n=1 Tax=Panaeolus cyanescens TaxID=181874 RepID=A0A409V8V6_9AGAR|nr:hypothetical protein CVT24_005982 [Panaeolus cyanescens]